MLTIKQIYNLAIQEGIKSDLRGKAKVLKKLKKEKDKFKELKKEEKETFDQERLTNPYSDTRILYGDPNKKVKTILAGIDISVSEMLLAHELTKKGEKIDLVLSHHPLGKALARLDDVMELQADVLADLGVPINIAEDLLEKKMSEVYRSVSPANLNRPVDTAQILNIPLICTHTACDNQVASFLQNEIKKAKPETVAEVMDLLKGIPEYKKASQLQIGPTIYAGSPKRRAGKIALTEITGGTAGARQIYKYLSLAGVGTIVGMHMSEEYKKEAEKHHINVIIAGHMASDSLGMNLFLDKLEAKGIKVIPCSGLIRIKRK